MSIGNTQLNPDSSQKLLGVHIDETLSWNQHMGAQWLSGRVLESRPKGRGFEPHWRHCATCFIPGHEIHRTRRPYRMNWVGGPGPIIKWMR